jgi:hypothetical protein
MTGQDYVDNIPNVIGDSLDQDFTIQLINDAKNSIETELQLEITKKLDATGSTSAGQTSITARSLPSDFFLPLNIYVGTEKYEPIPFEKQIFYKDTSGFYWVDLGNDQYHLCGRQGSPQTISFFYQKETTDLTSGTLDTWSPVWPSRFHSLILYEIAAKSFAFDQVEKTRSWLAEHEGYYLRLKRQMIDWDAKLKLTAMNHSAYSEDSVYESENKINF